VSNTYYRTTFPFTKFNDQLIGLSAEQRDILIRHHHRFDGQTWADPTLSDKGWHVITQHRDNFFSQVLIYLITETVGEYPYPYLTEKTWKAIVNQKPFMLLGAPGSLDLLKAMGFKTFDKWWDESYDSKKNIGDRIDGIVSQIEMLNKLSKQQLLDLEQQMLPTVSFNLKHLVTFQEQDLKKIANLI
jgi:hypothetical protein